MSHLNSISYEQELCHSIAQLTQEVVAKADELSKCSVTAPRSHAQLLEDQLQQLLRVLKRKVSDLSYAANEQETPEQTQRVAAWAAEHQRAVENARKVVQRARMSYQFNLQKYQEQQRRELIGAVDFTQRQQKFAREQDVLAGQQDVTASMRRTRQLLMQNLEQTQGNISVLSAGNKRIMATGDELSGQKSLFKDTHKHQRTLQQQSWLDRWAMYIGFAFFLLCVGYISLRRTPAFIKQPVYALLHMKQGGEPFTTQDYATVNVPPGTFVPTDQMWGAGQGKLPPEWEAWDNNFADVPADGKGPFQDAEWLDAVHNEPVGRTGAQVWRRGQQGELLEEWDRDAQGPSIPHREHEVPRDSQHTQQQQQQYRGSEDGSPAAGECTLAGHGAPECEDEDLEAHQPPAAAQHAAPVDVTAGAAGHQDPEATETSDSQPHHSSSTWQQHAGDDLSDQGPDYFDDAQYEVHSDSWGLDEDSLPVPAQPMGQASAQQQQQGPTAGGIVDPDADDAAGQQGQSGPEGSGEGQDEDPDELEYHRQQMEAHRAVELERLRAQQQAAAAAEQERGRALAAEFARQRGQPQVEQQGQQAEAAQAYDDQQQQQQGEAAYAHDDDQQPEEPEQLPTQHSSSGDYEPAPAQPGDGVHADEPPAEQPASRHNENVLETPTWQSDEDEPVTADHLYQPPPPEEKQQEDAQHMEAPPEPQQQQQQQVDFGAEPSHGHHHHQQQQDLGAEPVAPETQEAAAAAAADTTTLQHPSMGESPSDAAEVQAAAQDPLVPRYAADAAAEAPPAPQHTPHHDDSTPTATRPSAAEPADQRSQLLEEEEVQGAGHLPPTAHPGHLHHAATQTDDDAWQHAQPAAADQAPPARTAPQHPPHHQHHPHPHHPPPREFEGRSEGDVSEGHHPHHPGPPHSHHTRHPEHNHIGEEGRWAPPGVPPDAAPRAAWEHPRHVDPPQQHGRPPVHEAYELHRQRLRQQQGGQQRDPRYRPGPGVVDLDGEQLDRLRWQQQQQEQEVQEQQGGVVQAPVDEVHAEVEAAAAEAVYAAGEAAAAAQQVAQEHAAAAGLTSTGVDGAGADTQPEQQPVMPPEQQWPAADHTPDVEQAAAAYEPAPAAPHEVEHQGSLSLHAEQHSGNAEHAGEMEQHSGSAEHAGETEQHSGSAAHAGETEQHDHVLEQPVHSDVAPEPAVQTWTEPEPEAVREPAEGGHHEAAPPQPDAQRHDSVDVDTTVAPERVLEDTTAASVDEQQQQQQQQQYPDAAEHVEVRPVSDMEQQHAPMDAEDDLADLEASGASAWLVGVQQRVNDAMSGVAGQHASTATPPAPKFVLPVVQEDDDAAPPASSQSAAAAAVSDLLGKLQGMFAGGRGGWGVVPGAQAAPAGLKLELRPLEGAEHIFDDPYNDYYYYEEGVKADEAELVGSKHVRPSGKSAGTSALQYQPYEDPEDNIDEQDYELFDMQLEEER